MRNLQRENEELQKALSSRQAVKGTDQSATQELLQHLLAVSQSFDAGQTRTLSLALAFTRVVDALVYPQVGESHREDATIFTTDNLKRLHLRLAGWERLARAE